MLAVVLQSHAAPWCVTTWGADLDPVPVLHGTTLKPFQKALGLPLQVRRSNPPACPIHFTHASATASAAFSLSSCSSPHHLQPSHTVRPQLYAPYFCPKSEYFSRINP